MRRKEREITDREEIEEIIRQAVVCRVAMTDADGPYVVPVNFGFEDGAIWFHSAREGRKIDALGADPRVCVQIDLDARLVTSSRACDWAMEYRSVIAFGRAVIVDDPAEKARGLDAIMRQHGGPTGGYGETALARAAVVRIDIESLSGKKSG